MSASGTLRGSIRYTAGTTSTRTSTGWRRRSASASPRGPNFSRAIALCSALAIARRYALERLRQAALELRHLRGVEHDPDPAVRNRAVPREHADAGGAGVVVAAGALGAVLRGRVAAFRDLHSHIRIDEARQASRRVVEKRRHGLAGAVDQLDGEGGGHRQSASNGSTVTRSPAATSPRASSRMTRQLPATIDDRMPEPCGPVVHTSQSPSRNARMPRLYSVRPVFLRIGSSARACHVWGKSRRRPASL